MARVEDLVSTGRPETPEERLRARLERAGRALGAAQDAMLEARERPPIDARFAALRDARARRPRAPRDASGRLALGGGLAALAAAAAVALWVRSTSPLEFTVGAAAAPGEVGAWLAAAAPAAPLPIEFSDGSRLELAPGARARVVDVTARGARVVLERGAVDVSVVHRDATRWSVVSGPFEVHVIGTRFEATWEPSDESLTVRLEEGAVAIAGACIASPHHLRAGESVRLSCRDVVAAAGGGRPGEPPAERAAAPGTPPAGSTTSAPDAPPSPAATDDPTTPPRVGSADAPTEPLVARAEPAPPPSPAGAVAADAPRWRALAREGRGREAWAAAEEEGIEALIGALPGAELLQLADLARLAGRGADARRIYAAVRDRFAGSDAAAAAAFHLGRMSFDGSGAYAEAARWFSIYLAERPGGAFAPEATGRLMEALDRGGDRAGAARLAASYLERWPQGAHAALAASLVAP